MRTGCTGGGRPANLHANRESPRRRDATQVVSPRGPRGTPRLLGPAPRRAPGLVRGPSMRTSEIAAELGKLYALEIDAAHAYTAAQGLVEPGPVHEELRLF